MMRCTYNDIMEYRGTCRSCGDVWHELDDVPVICPECGSLDVGAERVA